MNHQNSIAVCKHKDFDEPITVDLRTKLIKEFIEVRKETGISQKDLEKLSGVKQPVIARMESGITNPQIDTILKLLKPLGKTLAIVNLERSKRQVIIQNEKK